MSFVMESVDPTQAGLRIEPIERMDALITRHIIEGRYPGAQIAIARHGKLAFTRNYGQARISPATAIV